ncbi:S8 family serine peptidase, partial [Streptomyces xanthophaeus]|uniref:S8 family serine peptidase n=1 Tax=Streptomyces xanthophaeus TaxID=67385 RepID=UPI003662E27F
INLSLGDDSDSAHHEAGEDEAVQYALAKGVVVVASAGNGGEAGDRISYPAAYPGVIAVTAVDRKGKKAPFSTRNWYATVSAPGVDVVIADPQFNSASNATLFTAPISGKFGSTAEELSRLGANTGTVKVVAGILVIIMIATTYLTSRQMILKTGWAE